MNEREHPDLAARVRAYIHLSETFGDEIAGQESERFCEGYLCALDDLRQEAERIHGVQEFARCYGEVQDARRA